MRRKDEHIENEHPNGIKLFYVSVNAVSYFSESWRLVFKLTALFPNWPPRQFVMYPEV